MNKKLFLLAAIVLLSIPSVCNAQVFSDDDWDDQKTMIMAKWSPLFYELNVGINVSQDSGRDGADFVYLSLGYGKPTTKNTWKKYLPTMEQPSDGNSGMSGRPDKNQGSQQAPPSSNGNMMEPEGDTSGLHAGTIGIGWQHFFNHVIGFHVQAGWGFIANFSSNGPSEPSSSRASSNSQPEPEEGSQKTFIYNTVPVQAGLDINLWKNLNLQLGATYMWKEKPVFTVGLGVAF